jgi:hypothetical protein
MVNRVMNLCYIVAGMMISATCCGLTASAQTPVPTSTPNQGNWTKWGSDYRVPGPKEGLVPDKETAIKIAEVVLFRLYGQEDTVGQRPYKVKEEDSIWWVSGTLKGDGFGSAFNIAISKQTGAILHLTH